MATHSPTRTNIQEANKHLQLLYARVAELEQAVVDRDQAVAEQQLRMEQSLADFQQRKDSEVSELKSKLSCTEGEVKSLQRQCAAKDARVYLLENKCKFQNDILSFKTPLTDLLRILENYEDLEGHAGNNVKVPNDAYFLNSLRAQGITLNTKPNYGNEDDMDEATESLDRSSPCVQQLTRHLNRIPVRHFSISEDEGGDRDAYVDEQFTRMKRDRELYL